MKLDHLKEKKQFVPHALLGVAGVLAILTFYKLWDYHSAAANAQSIVSKAAEKAKPDPDDVRKNLAGFAEIANAIKGSNLFIPIPEKRHPVNEVLGIMGDEALINDKWYKAGDRIGDARVIAVEPTQVKIEWDGNERYFAPLAAAGGTSGGPSARRGGPRGGEGESGGPPSEGPTPMMGGPFGDMSEEQRAEMRARFEGMRARFESMSPEERERFRNEMRDRFGGRGPGGPGGFGGRGGFDGGRGRR